MLIMIFRASLARIDQQLVDGVLRHVSDPRGGADAVAFDQKADDQRASFGVELIHMLNLSDRNH